MQIAIVGAGGTGKTTLAKLLSGEDLIHVLQPYQESINIERYKIDANLEASLIVVPGQERRADRWDELLQTLNDSSIARNIDRSL